jgi:hypothetical protein
VGISSLSSPALAPDEGGIPRCHARSRDAEYAEDATPMRHDQTFDSPGRGN